MIASTQTNHPIDTSRGGKASRTSIMQACARMREAGLRITQPRISILTSLINRVIPASIEQIYADLPPDTCDLVTVYRCLAVFQEIGLVRLSHFLNGTSAYQITLADDVVPTYYVVFKKDNEVMELDPESAGALRAVIGKIEKKIRATGHEKVSHIVEFFVNNAPSRRETNPPIPIRGSYTIQTK